MSGRMLDVEGARLARGGGRRARRGDDAGRAAVDFGRPGAVGGSPIAAAALATSPRRSTAGLAEHRRDRGAAVALACAVLEVRAVLVLDVAQELVVRGVRGGRLGGGARGAVLADRGGGPADNPEVRCSPSGSRWRASPVAVCAERVELDAGRGDRGGGLAELDAGHVAQEHDTRRSMPGSRW